MNCSICENRCPLTEGSVSRCGVYLMQGGEIIERYPNRYLIISPITIETMPMLHFQPRGKFLQISTIGCNLDCPGCISTVIVKEMGDGPSWLQKREPDDIIREAKKQDCLGISFLMNDPLASWPTFVNVAKKAKENKMLVGCSSNAFFTESSLNQVLPYLDFMNVGIKGFSDQAYQRCGARAANPVWRNVAELYRAGVHVEISCM
ncbi:MAG: radical SAM protein [Syntrophaceae bacterium]|nr:radical SAM protein [Syntrophaceae bacterium]